MSKNNWFEVDKNGLGKLFEKRGGKGFLLHELFQNAWDEDITRVDATLVMNESRRGQAILTITDDCPEGFKDLTHAYTLFAESTKKGDVSKRGRFNLGEKLILAICTSATITTTKGTVRFTSDGKRQNGRTKRKSGTEVELIFPLNKVEHAQICEEVKNLIPEPGIISTFNGVRMEAPSPLLLEFEASVTTEIADEEGRLRQVTRKTDICVYDTHEDRDKEWSNPGWIYEMGIPVVRIRAPFIIDVQQKVPVTLDRKNIVSMAWVHKITALVLNEVAKAGKLEKKEATKPWVTSVAARKEVKEEATVAILDHRFTKKRVAYDPHDKEANATAQSRGYTVVPGGSMGKDLWAKTKGMGAIKPAGQIAPTKRPEFSPDGEDITYPRENWTPMMVEVIHHLETVGCTLLETSTFGVEVVKSNQGFGAWYGGKVMSLNFKRLGRKWFSGPIEEIHSLMIHELAHDSCASHHDHAFHEACCNLGASLTQLALSNPALFKSFERRREACK